MEAVEGGTLLKTATSLHSILASTLSDRLSGQSLSGKHGPPSIFSVQEEKALEEYMIQMADLGHLLSMELLHLKVALLIQERPTPFTNGILESAWVLWFKKRHLDLALCQSQGLDVTRAKGLCPKNVDTFYKNLEELYKKYHYPPEHIWKCNEISAQAG